MSHFFPPSEREAANRSVDTLLIVQLDIWEPQPTSMDSNPTGWLDLAHHDRPSMRTEVSELRKLFHQGSVEQVFLSLKMEDKVLPLTMGNWAVGTSTVLAPCVGMKADLGDQYNRRRV